MLMKVYEQDYKYAKNFSDWLRTVDQQKDHAPYNLDNVEMTGMGKLDLKSC